MSEDLHDLLTSRADRAQPPPEPDVVVAQIAARVGKRTRTRRNHLAVASGAALVVAAATVGISIADTGSAPVDPPAGTVRHGPLRLGPGPSTPPDGRTATELPVLTPLHGGATGHGVRVGPGYPGDPTSVTLVKAVPAPAAAELSLGLAPEGTEYLGRSAATTFYGAPGMTRAQAVSDGIVVDVHRHVPGAEGYTLTVDGRRASFLSTDTGITVRVRYSRTIDVGFQAGTPELSRHQALRMAASLDVRRTTHTTAR